MKPLTPAQAILLAASILVRQGLEEVARSAGQDSIYLRAPGSRRQLRISNHRRTDRRRRQYPEVAHSLIFGEPKSERQICAMVDRALKAYLAAEITVDPRVPA